jgi:two-component system, LytTR family, response regulator
MKSITEKLSQQIFIRIHRSFIVPINKVDCLKNKIVIINGVELPIGSSYEPEVMKLFSKK